MTTIYLRGFLAAADDWIQVAEHCSLDTAKFLDLPAAENWHQGIERLAALLDRSACLVGYSLSVRVALACALRLGAPSIGRLVLVSGHAGLPATERSARVAHDASLAKLLATQGGAEFLDNWYQQPLFQNLSPDQRATWIAQRHSLNYHQQARLLETYGLGQQPDLWDELPHCSVPTLVVVGELDSKYRALGERLAKTLPHATLAVIPGAGHAVHREKPTEFAEVLQSWLELRVQGSFT